ncbi:MAG: glycoside hydrolase family 2 protein [Gemmatimonadetes bacterium]|jgi:beta-galactosidase|nr:glycoside hydrolase family 2 protein [Gemmatimonadota bacterium]
MDNAGNTGTTRLIEDFNFGWKFAREDQQGAEAEAFDDTGWRDVRLPHDWSVEESFTQENAGGSTAFLPGGIGWYRKTFSLPATSVDKKTWIEFDGVYSNAGVWINGHFLGKRPYGYVEFIHDLSPYLNYGDPKNSIAIRVDRSAYIDCRWYPGSGIYRHVKLVTAEKVHIPPHGVFITTPLATAEKAEVLIRTEIANARGNSRTAQLKTTLMNEEGNPCAVQETEIVFDGAEKTKVEQRFVVETPSLWDIDAPAMYSALSEIADETGPLDGCSIPFGIRTIAYDAEKGFFLNGRSVKFKGVCLHHDGGLVGAAVPPGVWERRLKSLKKAGCNALRTAHNPPSAEFLDLCDRIGFLVQNEAFDEWDNPKDKRHNYNQKAAEEVTRGYTEYFDEWAEADVESMVLRDRNHPCVVMWSIGNEIEWTYPRYGKAAGYWDGGVDAGYYYDLPPNDIETIKKTFAESGPGEHCLAETAARLAQAIREADTTRPVTANLVIPSVSHLSGYTDTLDVIGYSYRQAVYDYVHELYPEKPTLAAENWGQWHEWRAVAERDYLAGIFLWTGINYLGESHNWPNKASGSGLLDLAGFEKPSFQMFKSLWNDEPHLYIATLSQSDGAPYEQLEDGTIVSKKRNEKWMPMWGWHAVNEHWNYCEGDAVFVEVYTNCDEVELFLDGTSLGVRKLADVEDDRIMKWLVPYAPGKLTAIGKTAGGPVQCQLETAGDPTQIRLTADRSTLTADFYDVVHLTAQLCDAAGLPVRSEERELTFDIQGDCRLLGVDNGATDSVQDYQANNCTTSQGRCLLILQAGDRAGEVVVTASSGGLQSQSVKLRLG